MKKKINWAKVFVIGLIFLISCVLEGIFLYYHISYSKSIDSAMSTICQIQAAVIGIVLTVLTISTSITRTKIFGLTIKEIIALNSSPWKFTLLQMIIIQMILIIISVVALMISQYILIWVSFISSCVLAIWICCTDLPIAINGEEKTKKIIVIIIIKNNDKNVYEQKINTALYEMLVKDDFHTIFEELRKFYRRNKDINDKKILNKLIKVLIKTAQIINEETDINIAEKMIFGNIDLIFNFGNKEKLKYLKKMDKYY